MLTTLALRGGTLPFMAENATHDHLAETEFSAGATIAFVIGLLIVFAIAVSLYRRRRK
ncbi:hypothetical protein [Cohnella nanjingensis]|uniref:Uncharacterized protein n=1 Tax=Cohnella nanjingensis TaxID=1387779 RepID=A0A7X0RS70_9BACL|nr:hypothetical protein [Cohnella nanjingensis]MBB6672708.1 hypothetical protein [Cohnella nanjingensis]